MQRDFCWNADDDVIDCVWDTFFVARLSALEEQCFIAGAAVCCAVSQAIITYVTV
jgi:hypothetical protein